MSRQDDNNSGALVYTRANLPPPTTSGLVEFRTTRVLTAHMFKSSLGHPHTFLLACHGNITTHSCATTCDILDVFSINVSLQMMRFSVFQY